MSGRPHPEEDGIAVAEANTGMPRWVKISLIVTVVLILGVAALLFLGGHRGGPGPGMNHGSGMTAPTSSAVSGQTSFKFTDHADGSGGLG